MPVLTADDAITVLTADDEITLLTSDGTEMKEFKTKFESVLRADVTLRALLSKAATPYGVYYMKPPIVPAFPLIAYKLIGGTVSSAGREAQTRALVLQVTAYGPSFDDIMERVETILQGNPVFTGMTTCRVWAISPEVMGFEDFDVEFGTYCRMDRYRVFLSKIGL